MTGQWNVIYRVGGFPMLALLLASCGGGGDEPGKCYSSTTAVCAAVGVPVSSPEAIFSNGLYKGVSSTGRAFTALALDDHSFYIVYSGVNHPSAAGGAIQGTIRAEAGKFSITNAVDTNLEGSGTSLPAIAGTYETQRFINGSMSYSSPNTTVSFSANYTPDFELAPDMAGIAGSYSGASASGIGSEASTFQISGNGDFSGKSAGGCTFSGTIQKNGNNRPYAVTASFGGFPCRYPGASTTGIAYVDRTSNTLYAVGSVAGQNAGVVMIATKQ